jgi:hypothetical protein
MILKILGVLCLAAGVLIFVYHGFSIPRQREGKLGPIEVRMNQSERVDIPNWVGVAAVTAGGGLLLWSGRRK